MRVASGRDVRFQLRRPGGSREERKSLRSKDLASIRSVSPVSADDRVKDLLRTGIARRDSWAMHELADAPPARCGWSAREDPGPFFLRPRLRDFWDLAKQAVCRGIDFFVGTDPR